MSSDSFQVPARVGFGNLVEIRRAGEAYIDAHERTVFDLAGVDNANSAVVALLLAWFRHAHRGDREIVFTGASPGLRDILELTELDSLLPMQV